MARDYFDDPVAHQYEERWPELFASGAIEPVVDVLARLAGAGRALELGVGTGRIAIPLSRRGVRVHGIDLSPAMVAQLRAQAGSEPIEVTIGDIATTRAPGTFRLVYLLRNTIMNLTTQDDQVECFRTVASCLEPGGCFLIEVMVPELQRLPPGETMRLSTVTANHLGFDEYDVSAQAMVSHHHWVLDGRTETFSAPFRYVWPSELDLMARLAGMVLRHRWADWSGTPFTGESRQHISVWQRPPEVGAEPG